MKTRLYVGNLNYRTTQERLINLFSPYGEVLSARMISDRETGKFRGFAFVEMATPEGAEAAIKALDGKEVDGRQLKVNEAQDRKGIGENRGNPQ
jgi:RNA recognition motif-containing protein